MPAELIEQNQKRIKGHSNSAAYSISERGRAVGIPCAVHYVEHYFENNDLMLKIFDTAGSVSQLTSSYNRFRALEALQQGESTAWQNHFRIPLPWNTTKHHLENLTSSGYTQRKGKMYSITPKGMKAIEFGQEIRRIVKRGLKAQGREVFEIEREARRSQSRVGFEETLTRAVTDYLQKQNGGRKSGRVKLEDAKKAVMHYLTENATEQGIGRHAIANSLGYKRTTAETALRELTKEGNIVRQKNIFGKVNYLPRV